jgi:hypothetical protein
VAYVDWVNDKHLRECVRTVLQAAATGMGKAKANPNRNVLDPFSAIFDASSQGISLPAWMEMEQRRQAQKTMQNAVGEFHQNVLAGVTGWEIPENGYVDLVSAKQRVVAEVKNKHNTVKKSDLTGVYAELDNAVNGKTSTYKGYKGYYVAVIPQGKWRGTRPFTPPKNATGKQAVADKRILEIDGYSFYALVTGQAAALRTLYGVLPRIIADVAAEMGPPTQTLAAKAARYPEDAVFHSLFEGAFG